MNHTEGIMFLKCHRDCGNNTYDSLSWFGFTRTNYWNEVLLFVVKTMF